MKAECCDLSAIRKQLAHLKNNAPDGEAEHVLNRYLTTIRDLYDNNLQNEGAWKLMIVEPPGGYGA